MLSYGKTLFWKWRTSAVLHLENFEFWRSDCHLYRNSLYASNFIKIGQFSLRYGALTISTWRPQFLSCDLCRHASSYKIPLKRVDKLWPKKANFNMAAVRHLELKNFFLVIWLSSVSLSAVVVHHISSKIGRFLPRDAMQALPLPLCGVCPSVTVVHSVKTNKHVFELFSPSGSQTILVYPHQTSWQYSDGDTP